MAINRNSITKYPVVRRMTENEFKPASKAVIKEELKKADRDIVPSTIGVAVNVGCWSHRRGLVRFDRDLNATVISHKGVTL